MKYRTFDVSYPGADGTFETAMLIRELTPSWPTCIRRKIHPHMPSRNSNPDYAGVAKVMVAADPTPLASLKPVAKPITFNIAGTAVDDLTGAPIRDLMIQTGKVNPDNLTQIIWDEGFEGPPPDGRFLLWDQKEGSAVRLGVESKPQTITWVIIASRQTAKLQVRISAVKNCAVWFLITRDCRWHTPRCISPRSISVMCDLARPRSASRIGRTLLPPPIRLGTLPCWGPLELKRGSSS